MIKLSLEPLVSSTTKILILGSMPGDQSIIKEQYYANLANKFWYILYKILNEEQSQSYNERCNLLIRNGIGL